MEERRKNVLIVGAGEAGGMLMREIIKHPELGYFPVGFIDDDPILESARPWGLPVLGDRGNFVEVVRSRGVELVLIAIPSAPGEVVRRYVTLSKEVGIPFRIVPGVYELLDGNIKVEMVREVRLEDLLRRTPAKINLEEMATAIYRQTVLVTGAGGSIGAELVRQIAQYGPSQILLLGQGENSLYRIQLELKELFPRLEANPVIVSIQDQAKILYLFRTEQPALVFHAAAHKHIHYMEAYPEEAVKNNVGGTLNLLLASREAGVQRFINISTDKAVRPSSSYGASKRVGEMLTTSLARCWGLPYTTVRFGNVLGSTNSVVPLFQRQIQRGGPITITDPRMERYFMTIGEAVQLIIQAAVLGKGGEIFILDMGSPIRIVELAEELIQLSGLSPGRDIKIETCGLRPGEKLTEELFEAEEEWEETGRERIRMIRKPTSMPWETLEKDLRDLLEAATGKIDRERIEKIFRTLIPTMERV
ncbi:MAG: nucleoside-diphosphate sugar epimerase/dehydratase [bacterium]